jgi:hypothetical protein
MSDIENDDESILSENNNNINFIEDIENSYKTYINQLIDIIADILDKLTNKSNEESEKEKNEDENGELILLSTTMIEMEIFNTNKKPSVPVKKFLERVVKYCQPEPSTFITSLIYLDNILLKTKTKLTCMNSYKLFYACFVLSMKFNEDRHNSNKFYAKVCGVNINDFLLMEYRALKYLDFSLFIQTETYELYYNNIYSVY